MERASAVAHGGELGSTSEAALHTATHSLDPSLEVLSPARSWGLPPAELATLARERGVHLPPAHPFRTDASLWGRVVTAEPRQTIPSDAFTLTRSPGECPREAAFVDVEFVAGVPVRTNEVEMPMTELIVSLDTIAGAHGVGRSSTGDTLVEAPAVTLLDIAHSELEGSVLGTDLVRTKEQLSRTYADVMVSGRWFSDIRAAIDAFCGVVQARVTGTVSLRVHQGHCVVVARELRNGGDVPAAQTKVVA